MRRAAKKDANHNEIADTFRALGFSVADTSRLGDGFPDMVIARRSRTALIEAKSGNGKLRGDQTEFIDGWRGIVGVIRTTEEAIDFAAEHF